MNKDKLSCEHMSYETIASDGSFKCLECGGVFWNDGSDAEYYDEGEADGAYAHAHVNADWMSDGVKEGK